MLIDFAAIEAFLISAVAHYETSAPTVSAYTSGLYDRLTGNAYTVSAGELFRIQGLLEEGQWELPMPAANRVFHIQSWLGQDTTGHAGF